EAGVSSLTYFETTGPRGVVEREAGPPSAAFPSRPGQAFPLFHVLADLREWRPGVLVPTRSSEPLAVESLGVRTDRGPPVLVCNLPSAVQRCTLNPRAPSVRLRFLDEESAGRAGDDPGAFRAAKESRSADGGGELELSPYAVARVDLG